MNVTVPSILHQLVAEARKEQLEVIQLIADYEAKFDRDASYLNPDWIEVQLNHQKTHQHCLEQIIDTAKRLGALYTKMDEQRKDRNRQRHNMDLGDRRI